MKTIILAGGLGTRISEETDTKPKPMVLLDEHPIIWHLMNSYSRQGFRDFVVAAGYKGEVIQEWVAQGVDPDWSVSAIDTGQETMTGGRVKRVLSTLPNERVFVTYGDGLGNINLKKLLDFHEHHGRMATVTAVRPPARFGVLESSNGVVTHFGEKSQVDAGWINGGFMVLEPEIVEHISGDSSILESQVFPALVKEEQLMAFHHDGFWQPMDTLREKNELSRLAALATPPWLAE